MMMLNNFLSLHIYLHILLSLYWYVWLKDSNDFVSSVKSTVSLCGKILVRVFTEIAITIKTTAFVVCLKPLNNPYLHLHDKHLQTMPDLFHNRHFNKSRQEKHTSTKEAAAHLQLSVVIFFQPWTQFSFFFFFFFKRDFTIFTHGVQFMHCCGSGRRFPKSEKITLLS